MFKSMFFAVGVLYATATLSQTPQKCECSIKDGIAPDRCCFSNMIPSGTVIISSPTWRCREGWTLVMVGSGTLMCAKELEEPKP